MIMSYRRNLTDNKHVGRVIDSHCKENMHVADKAQKRKRAYGKLDFVYFLRIICYRDTHPRFSFALQTLISCRELFRTPLERLCRSIRLQ